MQMVSYDTMLTRATFAVLHCKGGLHAGAKHSQQEKVMDAREGIEEGGLTST